MKKQTPESSLLSQVRDYLRISGWYVIRIQQGLGCHKGISDLIAIKDGRTAFIEIKAPNGKLSEYQKKFGHDVIDYGGHYCMFKDFEDVRSFVNSFID